MFRREYLSSVVNVLTNSVKISDHTKADFAELNLPRFQRKYVNSGAELISAVFGTRKHVDYRMVF